MTNMFGLIQNENMKIYRRLRSWIMLGLLPLLIIAGCVFDTIYQDKESDWKKNELSAVEMLKSQLSEPDLSETVRAGLEKELIISEYRLEHNIPQYEDASMWGIVSKSASFVSLVTIFTAIVAADIVASEFSWGTIKLLLIRPASRSQILLSKYVAVLQYALILLVFVFSGSMLIGGLIFGFDGATVPHLVIKDGNVQEMSSALYLMRNTSCYVIL